MGDTASMTSAQSTTLMQASMATSAVSSIASTIGQANAIKAQASYAETIARTNAALGKLKARQALEVGDTVAARKNLESQAAAGSFRAAAGASGVDVNKGSTAAVQSEIGAVGNIDALTIKNNAARAAWGFETQALEDLGQGEFEKLTGRSKVQQTIATGGLQAISGPLSIYGNYLRWSRYMGGGGKGAGIVMPWSSGSGSSPDEGMATG